ncbi:peroxiredoxin [bacterium]|nr:peroxiredoxin [bacterium]
MKNLSLDLIAHSLFFLSVFSANKLLASDLKIGSKSPQVSAINQDGAEVDLGKEAAKGYTLVYFYPKADTPGCTAQACSIRDHFDVLTKKDVKVYGVSSDKVKAQLDFKEKYRLPFDLLADTDKKVIKAFGVSSMMGFSSRQAFLIKDGVIVWIDRKASTKEQADDVLKFLEANS